MAIKPLNGKTNTDNWIASEAKKETRVYEKEGRKYVIFTQYEKHNFIWKVWQGTKALFLTLFSWSSEKIKILSKDKWEEAITGLEEHYIIERLPPSSLKPTTDKMKMLGTTQLLSHLDDFQKKKLDILVFLDQWKSGKQFSQNELENRLNEALSIKAHLTNMADLNALLEVGEAIARGFSKAGDESKAIEFRKKTELQLFGKISDERIKVLNFLDKLRYNPESCDVTYLKSQIPLAIKRADVLSDPNDFKLLMDAAEKIALHFVSQGLFDHANDIRIQAAHAFLNESQINNIKILGFIEQFNSPKFDPSKDIAPLKEAPKEYLKTQLTDSLLLVNSGTNPQVKKQLLKISEQIAAKYDGFLDYGGAAEVRMAAAIALLPEAISGDHEILNAYFSLNNLDLLSQEEIDRAYSKLASIQNQLKTPYETSFFTSSVEKIALHHLKENNIDQAFNYYTVASLDFENLESPTTFLSLLETQALQAIEANDFETAMSYRMYVANLPALPPLGDLQARLAKEDPKLGVKLHPVDTSLFKNHSLSIQSRTFQDGSKSLHVDAKLGYPTRAVLQKTLDWIVSHPSDLHKGLPTGFCSGIEISTETGVYLGRTAKDGKEFAGPFSPKQSEGFKLYAPSYYLGGDEIPSENTVIEFKGVGKVRIGKTEEFRTQYNRISIDLEPGVSDAEAAQKLTILFAALGLEAVASSARQEDEERIKILQLFRAFYPSQAYDIERAAQSYQESIESLKMRIEALAPDMKQKFKLYLEDQPDLMYKQEVYPGQPVWAIKGIAQEVKNAGGVGLMASMVASTFSEAAERFGSILRLGALSTYDRFEHGIIAGGSSSGPDLRSGGGEYVFTRMITTHMNKDPSQFPLSGKFAILYDIDLVEQIGMAYGGDSYGTKAEAFYKNRSNVVDVTRTVDASPSLYEGNEFCIHHRIPPKYIKGVVVETQNDKEALVAALRIQGLVTADSTNQELINGVPIDQFVHVGAMKPEYWA